MNIDRQFLRIAEGQVHLRHIEAAQAGLTPLWLLHASPASSRIMEPLLLALREAGCKQSLVAPDTLGNGDSVAPSPAQPDIAYFADSVARVLDAARVEKIDIYGSHTGARIACEFAAAHPSRVRRVILDGITEYPEALRKLMLENYAPEVVPDDYGRQLIWAFNFVRDQWLHFPYFLRDPEHRLMSRAMPSAEQLHLGALDVLKAIGSYHKAYLAAFRYETFSRLAKVTAPVLFLRPEGELSTLNDAVAALMRATPNGRSRATNGTEADKAAAIADFLETAS